MIKELKKLIQDTHPKTLQFHLKKLDKINLSSLLHFYLMIQQQEGVYTILYMT